MTARVRPLLPITREGAGQDALIDEAAKRDAARWVEVAFRLTDGSGGMGGDLVEPVRGGPVWRRLPAADSLQTRLERGA